MIPKHLPPPVGPQTYFITSSTLGKRPVFQVERWARLFLVMLYHYRKQGHYRLLAFVLMPDHFHLLITTSPGTTLERALQLIKGGSAYQLKQAGRKGPAVWQKGYTDRRVRNAEEYKTFVEYIQQNPVKAGMVERPEKYKYCSAYPGYKLDPPRPYLSG
ncbi:MAG: transposase [Acidobacteriales bacterium]|nr:transposase [Terriglobales bacterium]